MRRSTDRILTTHVGALERPPELAKTLVEQGQWAPGALDQLTAENVIAGADCGFGARIHPELGWAKLAALVEGAALASSRAWKS